MRIQNNNAANNALRQYSSNNTTLSKNLEKLSSGYRINRAGDDAAGLAISEKMRSQITGLEKATDNSNDGISLVQTAEGALTEVHSMLNRMTELATQSANGTFDDETDRANLQEEVDSLLSEIDRISKSTNYNGINLLDGSLGSSAAGTVQVDAKYASLSSNPGVLTLKSATANTTAATAGAGAFTAGTSSLTLKYSDANGELQEKTVDFTSVIGTVATAANGTAIQKAISDTLGDGYDVTVSGAGALSITSKTKGSDDKFELFSVTGYDAATPDTAITTVFAAGSIATTKGEDAFYNLDAATLASYDGAATTNADDYTFEINGAKFAFVNDSTAASKLDADVNYVKLDDATNGVVDVDVAAMVALINEKTGIGAIQADTDGVADSSGTFIALKAGTTTAKGGNGLSLQIGDTAEKFNQITVEVSDMSSKSLGISGVDISSQGGAEKALEKIKSAINSVSGTRGKLGAIQNRLEHTINNLSVATENITEAESRIRDVDMAKEMTEYTQNNILSQASQAMLAQANQLPQGVLQLLQ